MVNGCKACTGRLDSLCFVSSECLCSGSKGDWYQTPPGHPPKFPRPSSKGWELLCHPKGDLRNIRKVVMTSRSSFIGFLGFWKWRRGQCNLKASYVQILRVADNKAKIVRLFILSIACAEWVHNFNLWRHTEEVQMSLKAEVSRWKYGCSRSAGSSWYVALLLEWENDWVPQAYSSCPVCSVATLFHHRHFCP